MRRSWIGLAPDGHPGRSRHWWLLLAVAWLLAACAGPAAPPTPTSSPQVQAGQQVFARECGSCHSTAPDTVIVGPSLAGVATRAASRVPGMAGTDYLLTSILNPSSFLVPGFTDLMPQSLAKNLTGEEVDAVVAYLQTLR